MVWLTLLCHSRTEPSRREEPRPRRATREATGGNRPRSEEADGARSSDGEWLVIVLWRTAADAAASMARSEVHAAHAAFMALLDPATVRRKQYTTLD